MIPEGQTNLTPLPTAELLSRLLETLEMEPQLAPDTTVELLRREMERLGRVGGGRPHVPDSSQDARISRTERRHA